MKFNKTFFALLAIAAITAITLNAEAAKKDKIKTSRSAVTRTSTSQTKLGSALSGTVIRPLLGYSFSNPKELNNMTQQNFFNNDTSTNVGGAMVFGVAAEYPVYENSLYAGIRLERFSTSGNSRTIGGSKITGQSNVSATPMMLTAAYKTPITDKMHLIPNMGLGLAFGYSANLEISGSEFTQFPNGTLSYGATPMTALFGVGADYEIASNMAVRFDAGYRLLKSDQLKATKNYGTTVKEGDLAKDEKNNNIALDMSAFTTTLSLAIEL